MIGLGPGRVGSGSILSDRSSLKRAELYAKYQGDERANRVANLKTLLMRQQDFLKKATKKLNAAVETSYVFSDMIATMISECANSKYAT